MSLMKFIQRLLSDSEKPPRPQLAIQPMFPVPTLMKLGEQAASPVEHEQLTIDASQNQAIKDLSSQRPIIRLNRMGNIANYMIQVMVAFSIKANTASAQISGEGLPEWNIVFRAEDDPGLNSITVDKQRLDVKDLGRKLDTGEIQRINMMSYAQNMVNFLPKQFYRELFDGKHIEAAGYPDTHLVINIRGGEILDAVHPLYTLLPVSFYREIIQKTGLIPVFMGQIGNDPYSQLLKSEFPSAVFQPSQGVLQDFETIRRSKNIVCAVSTFSWLAAWLSEADSVHFPLSGLFNPFQVGEIDLVALDDSRVRLYLFPINIATGIASLRTAHDPMEGLWREVTHSMYRSLLAGKPRFSPSDDDWIAVFDEEFYLTCYPDLREAVVSGHFPSGRHHYVSFGIRENRASFYFDGDWYSRAYPVAALEVAQGDFLDLRHHYVAIGRQRGYRAVPA